MNKDSFVEEVSKRIMAEKCDLFVGSGISNESHVPLWSELLIPLAKDLGIELDDSDDLPMIAQYIVNNNGGNKNIIYSRLDDCYDKDCSLNKYHNVISKMSFNCVWTTNYDLLLERCFSNRSINRICKNSDLARRAKKRGFELIKLHGSIDGDYDDIVLTQQEYDECLFKKSAIAQKLRDSFIQKSFLFIGYGYRDPDIRNIMIEATKQADMHPQDHYIILFDISRKDEETAERFDQRKKRFDLWLKELNRIGIRELIVKDSDELVDVLNKIDVKSRGRSVFVSGSHSSVKTDFFDYGKRLAKLDDVVMISGQNQGVGISVVNGFMEEAVNAKKELDNVIKVFPNPYAANPAFSNDKSLLPQLKNARMPMFLKTKLFVVFAGGMGTKAEVEVAKEKGCDILIAVMDTSEYENPLIKALLSDDYCNRCMCKVPEYSKLITSKKVPSLDELVNATEVLLNA